uniref:Uncharacterized protein n=1 Tax=Arundo donax TaxID=35708 RepID=A0A0A9CYY5_ARUDO
MITRTQASGCSAVQTNLCKKILVVSLAILNVLSRMKELAFCRVDSARNLMVVIIALAVGNIMIYWGPGRNNW